MFEKRFSAIGIDQIRQTLDALCIFTRFRIENSDPFEATGSLKRWDEHIESILSGSESDDKPARPPEPSRIIRSGDLEVGRRYRIEETGRLNGGRFAVGDTLACSVNQGELVLPAAGHIDHSQDGENAWFATGLDGKYGSWITAVSLVDEPAQPDILRSLSPEEFAKVPPVDESRVRDALARGAAEREAVITGQPVRYPADLGVEAKAEEPKHHGDWCEHGRGWSVSCDKCKRYADKAERAEDAAINQHDLERLIEEREEAREESASLRERLDASGDAYQLEVAARHRSVLQEMDAIKRAAQAEQEAARLKAAHDEARSVVARLRFVIGVVEGESAVVAVEALKEKLAAFEREATAWSVIERYHQATNGRCSPAIGPLNDGWAASSLAMGILETETRLESLEIAAAWCESQERERKEGK